MGDLHDNRGEFDPNRRLEDFTSDFLASLAMEYARAYLAMDGFWNGAVTQKSGKDAAMDCELLVWRRMATYALPKIARLAEIELPVRDLLEALKVWQITPDQVTPDIYKIEYDVKDRNHVIGTVTYCATLERLEKSAPDMIIPLCHRVEVDAVEAQCRVLHPGIKATALKLPPRSSPNEIACQWDYRLET